MRPEHGKVSFQNGRLFQINISDGGVPKTAVREVCVTNRGLVGDRQRNKVHHGGPERAVTLYSLERILDLQSKFIQFTQARWGKT